jgi:hypothetical protein
MVCHSFRFGKARQSASSRGIRATRRGWSQRAELLQQEVCALINTYETCVKALQHKARLQVLTP